ncbi:phospholipase [Carnobacterium sp. CS13]|uniref:alpha/beta hydrolase n=1 Tax=Carnobacterium sp. CS13 TaxID=2800128 RepID=UPI0019134DF3|nr:phospholipase [Carnobacterium sp. CS13]QQP70116.1 phospholipase [Carnobacterium sp. CS13]
MNYINIPGSTNEFFVLFHGTGGNEYSLLSVIGDINPNASVISFLGDVGSGAGRRFFDPLQNGHFLRDNFNEKVNQFLTLWDAIKPIDAKLTFVGYSNGANFLLGLMGKRPNIADNVVLMHPSNLGYTFESGSNSNIFLTSGATDIMAIPSESLQLSKQLAKYFPSTKLELLDSGHEVANEEVSKIGEFLRKTQLDG